MPLGSIYAINIKGKKLKDILHRTYLKLFGVADLHSHIRYRAIKKYFQSTDKNVEIGAGSGLMTFEFAKETGKNILGVIYEKKDLNFALETLKNSNLKNVSFIQGGLPHLKLKENYYDQVLLIDVLEHVQEDLESLKAINKILRPRGYLIISVPTPNYPKYFGYEFANKIGHLRDGYTIEQLKELLTESGFEIIKWDYYTNSLASNLCKIWYKCKIPFKLKLLLMPIANFLSYFDVYTSKKHSCSIVLLAQKIRIRPHIVSSYP
jgi:SAM-dependent methyltransferase